MTGCKGMKRRGSGALACSSQWESSHIIYTISAVIAREKKKNL
jgi:hypothetical protein